VDIISETEGPETRKSRRQVPILFSNWNRGCACYTGLVVLPPTWPFLQH